MSKIMSLDKQIEERAKKWFLNSQLPENRRMAKSFFTDNKTQIVKQYLKEHPKVNEEYNEKKKILVKAKIALATAGLVATTLAGTYILNQKEQPQENIVKQETELNDNFMQKEQEQLEENKYEKFFEEAREMKNTNKREEYITNQTKQIIVEAYNKEHPDNLIAVDRLETLILEETVLKKTDRLGNITYERISQNSVGEDLVKIGSIYDFRIDGKTVAVFDSNGDILTDKNVEKQDMSFKEALSLVKQSEELKDIYRYPSNDYEKGKVEQKYTQIANDYLENVKDKNITKNENER